jgi:allantoinase
MHRDFEIVIRGSHMVFPDGERAADLGIDGETIGAVGAHGALSGDRVIDVADLLVMPGAVDTHIHINEPGRTEWEGFTTATRAAAAGGVTTLVDMPLNSAPVTTTREAFELKLAAAEGKLSVDVGFWGGVVPGNADEIEGLLDAGVLGFKCFMVHSGIDDFPAVDEPTLRAAMTILAKHGKPLLAHAEWNVPPSNTADRRSPRAWAASRPPSCEVEAVELLVRLARETGCPTHVVHVAAAEVLPILAAAQREGLPITAETCPPLPPVLRRRHPRGRHPVQMRPAYPRRQESRSPVGGPPLGRPVHGGF